MPVIFDTGALVRPAFDPAEFTATKWETGADKAGFANGLCRFIAADFKLTLFTDKLYRRLATLRPRDLRAAQPVLSREAAVAAIPAAGPRLAWAPAAARRHPGG